jgi:hypothetical protein
MDGRYNHHRSSVIVSAACDSPHRCFGRHLCHPPHGFDYFIRSSSFQFAFHPQLSRSDFFFFFRPYHPPRVLYAPYVNPHLSVKLLYRIRFANSVAPSLHMTLFFPLSLCLSLSLQVHYHPPHLE